MQNSDAVRERTMYKNNRSPLMPDGAFNTEFSPLSSFSSELRDRQQEGASSLTQKEKLTFENGAENESAFACTRRVRNASNMAACQVQY
jgi:hypothetical protein